MRDSLDGSYSTLLRPVPRMGWSDAIVGLRGFCIVIVMVFHFSRGTIFTGIGLIVDILFVLSAYLVTRLALEEYSATQQFDRRAFFMRRAIRLLPAMYALLVVFTLFALFFGGEFRKQFLIEAAANAFYVYNFLIAYAGVEGMALVQLWALSTEEQFHLLFPLMLAILMSGKYLRIRILLVIAALFVVLMPAIRMFAEPAIGERTLGSTLFGFSILRMDALFIGAFAAFAHRWYMSRHNELVPSVFPRISYAAWAILMACVMLGSTAFFRVFTSPIYNIAMWLLPVIVIDLATRPDSWIAKTLSHPLIGWFGKHAYALYIWHMLCYYPVQAFFDGLFEGRDKLSAVVATPFAFALSMGVAALSQKFIEGPAMKLKTRFEANRSGVAASSS